MDPPAQGERRPLLQGTGSRQPQHGAVAPPTPTKKYAETEEEHHAGESPGLDLDREDSDIVIHVSKTGHAMIVTFDPASMMEWDSMLHLTGTVFTQSIIWIAMGAVVLIAGSSGVVVYFFIPGASVHGLSQISQFLSVFLAFMIGLFVNTAFTRWWGIAECFGHLCQDIKMLYYRMGLMDMSPDARARVRRWGCASVWLLCKEAEALWDKVDWEAEFGEWEGKGLLTWEEKQRLMSQGLASHRAHRSELLWGWIGRELHRACTNHVPPVDGPTYNALMLRCTEAQAHMAKVKATVLIQVPFMYVHMLAFMVHFTNILNALVCGITVGAEAFQHVHHGKALHVSDLLVSALICLLGPLLYLSFMLIAAELCVPIGTGAGDLPIPVLMKSLEKELDGMDDIGWAPGAGPQ